MPYVRTCALKTAFLVSVAGLAFASATPASAITATTPTNFNVVQVGTTCFIDFNSTITGVDDDGNGNDNYIIRTRFGSTFGPGSFPSIAVGSTQTSFQAAFFQNPNSSGGTVEVVIFERGATTALGPELASAQVPVALLNAAGGTCAQGVQNLRPTTDAGAAQSVAGGSTVTLQGSANDPEGDPLSFRWTQLSGPSVTLSDDTILAPTFAAPARGVDDQVLRFNLRTTETNRGRSISDNVEITVIGNEAPVAVAGATQTVPGGASVTLDASGSSDAERDALTYSWRQLRGPSVTLSNANTPSPSFTAPVLIGNDQTLEFEVTVTDTFGEFARATQAITVEGNAQPIADAGPDQGPFVGGTQVTLDGSGSTDPEGTPLTYSWRQTFGVPVVLSDPNGVAPTFATPSVIVASAALVFELQVSDGVSTRSDTVQINLTGSRAPTADAGPDQTVTGGSAVRLSGTATDPDGDQVTFLWTQTAGPGVTLSDPTIAAPSFTAPATAAVGQTLIFQLVATDDSQAMVPSAPDTVTITIPANQTPQADIQGPANPITGGSTVFLDGSGSIDPDGQTLTYQWTQTSGTSVTISGQGTSQISFTAPAGAASLQPIGFQLIVTDPIGASDAAVFTTSVAANNAPIADAGSAQNVVAGQAVRLNGTGSSDADQDTLTYLWSQVSGPSVTFSDPTSATPTATIPDAQRAAQAIVLSLVVNDGQTDSAPAQVTLTLEANVAPSADAGADADVDSGALVTLDASASSDPEGDTLTYAWTQISGPAVTLSNPSSATPSFTAPAATSADQALIFEVLVTDGVNASPNSIQRDQVTVTINANRPPIADAGVDQGPVNAGQTVTLDASGSSDPDGNALTYRWVQTDGPAVTLSDAMAIKPTFRAPDSNATLTFELTVSDGLVNATDSVSIEVQAVGSITIVQRIVGTDTLVSFTSDVAALNTGVTTSNGIGQVSAQNIPIGSYTVTAADLSAQGIAITDISCSDTDSTGSVSARSVSLELDAGEDVTCTFSAVNSREAAQAAIYNFLTGRNALILANQPDLQRRIDRLNANGGTPEQGGLNASGVPLPGAERLPIQATLTSGRQEVSGSLAMLRGGDKTGAFDMWFEASLSRARIGDQEGNFSIVHVGADLRISENLLIGALVQFDDFDDRGTFESGEAQGNGFLVGPYLTARLAPQLFVEARAAWGSSDNTVSPLTGQVDKFDTSRALYSGSVVGEVNLGQATILRPELTLRHFSEDQQAYVDALSIAIPSQTIDQGDLSFRPRLSHLVETNGDIKLRPYAQVEGIYTFGTEPDAALSNLLAGSFADQFGGIRARLEGGVDLMGKGSFRATLSGFYDGIGADGFSNEGVSLGVSFGF